MRLKCLDIHGFKSFPEKINISFGDGITSIVGPNGSGKSNIVDAIRWVLGEQSTKMLRGGKMEDVIFSGTSERRPLGYCEVILTIDNSDKQLQTEYNEVSISRRLYRSGESEYYLNKTQVRLRDIHELLMNTGLGKDGYSVIGQGRIAEVLSVKSEDRRQIFEEAAGISKYRYRKVEAERKIAATSDNLVRLNDIKAELEERVEPLFEESEKAKKYLSFFEEKKQLEINVWLNNIDNQKDLMAKAEGNLLVVQNQLSDVEKSIEELEKTVENSYDTTVNYNVLIDNTHSEISEKEKECADTLSEKAVIETNILHNNEKIQDLSSNIGGANDKVNELELQIVQKTELAAELAEKLTSLKEGLSKIILEFDSTSNDTLKINSEIEQIENSIAAITSEITESRIKISSLTALSEGVSTRSSNIDNELSLREASLSEALDNKKAAKERFDNAAEIISTNENIIAGYTKKLEAKQARIKELNDINTKLLHTIEEKSRHAKLLSDMESHYEGLSSSVKVIMGESGRRLSGIHGPLSSLIKTEDEYTAAIETALGGAISNIVVDRDEDAKAAILFLKNEKAGRCTFLPLSAIKGSYLEEKAIKTAPGYISIGCDLLTYDKKYDSIIKNFLGKTVVCDNIDNAVKMAKQFSYRFRIVTLDGQLINAGGAMTGGSLNRNIGILSRANEVKKLVEETEKLKAKAQVSVSELNKQNEEQATVQAGLDGAYAELKTANDEKIRAEGNLSQYDTLIMSIRQSISSLSLEKDNLYKESATALQSIEEINKVIGEKTALLEQLNKQMEELEGEYEKSLAGKDELSEKINSHNLEIVSVQKDIESNNAIIEETKRQKLLFSQESEQRVLEIELLKQKNTEFELKLAEIDQKTAELQNEITGLKQKIVDVTKDREKLEGEIAQVRKQIKEVTGSKEQLIKELSRLEGKLSTMRYEYDNITARLWDDYELTYSEAQKLRTEIASVSKANSRINALRNEIKRLGNVNVGAIDEYKLVKERYDFYREQIADLEKSKADLLAIINDLTSQMKDIFSSQFKIINEKFNEVFKELFGGGRANLELTDPSDILTSGIEIQVSPPGKVIKSLLSLSGGEQAFVAIALYFAILKVKPSPFCVLDEIEAALDDINVTRFAQYLRKFANKVQFVVITHRRGTMEESDILYGVTMQEKGVSKLLTINVNDIEKQLKLTK